MTARLLPLNNVQNQHSKQSHLLSTSPSKHSAPRRDHLGVILAMFGVFLL